jgi:transposase
VPEAVKGYKTLAQLSSDYGIPATQITVWKPQALEGMPSLFNGKSNLELSSQVCDKIEALLFQ